MPSRGKRYHINAYLGNDDLGELRLQALKALASESGCASDGEPSMGQWMRYLADLRIQEEGTGYVGVIRDDRDGKRIIFLTRIPEASPDGQLLVEAASGVTETWDRAECTGVLGSSAARRLLHAHGVRIPNYVGIVRHVWYLTGGSTEAEAHNRANAYAQDLQRPPEADAREAPERRRSERYVHTRFAELLRQKEAREGRRYSQREIEAASGVATERICALIRGDVQQLHAHTIEALCDFLGCEIADLLVLVEGGR